jgi:type I restriction enzyme, S subunit
MQEWKLERLQKIISLVKGITYSSIDYCGSDEGAVFLTIKCVTKSGGFKREGIKYYRGPIREKELLKLGDILIANTDLTRDGDIVGCPIMVPDFGDTKVTMSMDLSKLVVDKEQVDPLFLYYLLMTSTVRRYMQDHASGSTVLHLQTKAVPELQLLFPINKFEQTQIAAILSTLDQAIEQTEAIIAKQQRIKTGLMQDLLTKGVDENGNIRSEATHEFKNSPLGRVSVEWEIKKLGEISKFVTSGSRGWAKYYSNEGSLFIRIGNLTREHINLRLDDLVFVQVPESSEGKRTAVSEGDLLISITADLGIVGIIPKKFSEAYINQHIALVRMNLEKVVPRFIGHLLNGAVGQSQIEKLNESGAKAGLNLPTIENLLILLPNKAEQKRIAEILDSIDNQIAHQKRQVNKLNHQKRGLMHDLLTGKVRVTNLQNSTLTPESL